MLIMFAKFFTNFVVESDAWNLLQFPAPFFERVAICRFFIRLIWFLQVTFNIILSFMLASNFFTKLTICRNFYVKRLSSSNWVFRKVSASSSVIFWILIKGTLNIIY